MKRYFKCMYVTLIFILTTIIPIKVNANGITLNKSQITIGVGYSEVLKYTLGDNLNSEDIIWTSSNSSVVTVENGKIIALSEGWSIITASINGIKSTCSVTVVSDYIPVTWFGLNKSSTTLLVGQTESINATISPANATNKKITWISSNPSVASVNSSGAITAKSVGTTTITASISGIERKCEVTVTYSLSLKGISLNKTSLTIKETETEQLNIIYNPTEATNKKITWRSSNENIAKVSSNGQVTAISPGTATITVVSNDGGYVATCKVTVEEISKKVTGISLNKNDIELVAGETFELKESITPSYAENKNVTWTSSDEKIATVVNGVVTALYPGTVEIKVTSKDGNKEAICKVRVTSPPVESITFSQTEQTVYKDSELTLKVTLTPEKAVLEEAIWTSSDENIATVKNGKVSAHSLGETTITVSNKDNTLKASIKIIVVEKPKEPLNITIDGYDLKFNPTIDHYDLSIGNESELIIKTNVDKDKVTIKGNQNLKDGSLITITVADTENVTYVINIKKKKNLTIYFIAIISILLFLNLIRIAIKSKKKPKL